MSVRAKGAPEFVSAWKSARRLRKLTVFLAALLFPEVVAQEAEVRIGPTTSDGNTVEAAVILVPSPSRDVAAVQLDVVFPPNQLTFVTATAGPAVEAAQKTLSIRLVKSDTLRCIVAGLNQTGIGEGRIATVTFTALTSRPDYPIKLVGVQLADPSGAAVPAAVVNQAGELVTVENTSPFSAWPIALALITVILVLLIGFLVKPTSRR